MTVLFSNYLAIQWIPHLPHRNKFKSRTAQGISPTHHSVTYYFISTVSFIKGILKMVLRTNNLGTNFAVR